MSTWNLTEVLHDISFLLPNFSFAEPIHALYKDYMSDDVKDIHEKALKSIMNLDIVMLIMGFLNIIFLIISAILLFKVFKLIKLTDMP